MRLLKEENNDLKKMIEELNSKLMGSSGGITDEDRNKFIEMKEQFEANSKAIIDNGN